MRGVFRKLIRVGDAYYVSVPKSVCAEFRLFRGSILRLQVDGSRLIFETKEEKFMGGLCETLKK